MLILRSIRPIFQGRICSRFDLHFDLILILVLKLGAHNFAFILTLILISTFKIDFAGQSMDSLGRPLTHTGLPHSSLGEQL